MASETSRDGLLFVLVGPTAVGKNELMKAVLSQCPQLVQMPTATTRPIRANEQEGREHFFVDRARFQQLIDSNALLEHQYFHDNWYGTVRERLEEAIERGQDQIADIEVLGASAVHASYPDNSILIFISPPDPHTLETRIRKRGSDTPQEIELRLRRIPFEMQFAARCQYLIVNDKLDQAAAELVSIIQAERIRRRLNRFVTVRVLIRHAGRMVVRQDTGELPAVILPHGHLPQAAIETLAANLGLEFSALTCLGRSPEGEIAPTSYSLAHMDSRPQMDLLYTCETEADHPLFPGWAWRLLDSTLLTPGA